MWQRVGPRERVLACLVLGFGLLLMGAWLALPRHFDPAARPLTVVLRDHSPSARVGFADAAAYADWLAEITPGAGAERDVRVLDFATRLEAWSAASGAASAADLGARSHVDRALREVQQRAADPRSDWHGRLQRVVLVSDGSFTGPDPAARLAALAAAGVELELVQPPRPLPDVGLLDLDVAPRFAQGERVRVGFDVLLTPAGAGARLGSASMDLVESAESDAADAGALDSSLDSGPARRSVTRGLVEVEALPAAGRPDREPVRVLWPPGPGGLFTLTPDAPRARGSVDLGALAPGAWRIRVALEAAGLARTQRSLTRTVVVGPQKRVLVVHDDGASFGAEVAARRERAAAFFSSAPPGFTVTHVPLGELVPALPGADLLVSWDVPLGRLPGAIVAEQVDVGMGLLALGSFGQLDVTQPIDPWLVRKLPLVPDDDQVPPRRVILLVDGSGSMEGAPFDAVKRATLELVQAAPAQDEVALAFFNDRLGASWVLRPAQTGPLFRQAWTPERQADELRQMLDSNVPGGDTRILQTLKGLIGLRKRTVAHPAVVILLSDGAENALDSGDPLELLAVLDEAKALAGELRELDTQLSVISIQGGARTAEEDWAARQLLSALVAPGDELIEVDLSAGAAERAGLASVFAREVAGALVLDGGAGPGGRPLELAVEVGAEAAALWPADARLRAQGRYRLRPGAAVVAWGQRSGGEAAADGAAREPLLAVREGVGRVALLATEPGSGWAPDWTDAAGLAALLGHLAPGRTAGFEAWLEGGGLVVEVSGAAADTPDGLAAELALPGEPAQELALLPDPLRPGLFVAGLPAEALEAGWARVDLWGTRAADGRSGARRQLASLALDLGTARAELAPERPRFGLPTTSSAASIRGAGPHPWSSPLLGLGLVALFAAFLARP